MQRRSGDVEEDVIQRNDRGKRPERRASPQQIYQEEDVQAGRPHAPPSRRAALDPAHQSVGPHYRSNEGECGSNKRRQQYLPAYDSYQQDDAWDPHAAAGMKRARRAADPRWEQGGGDNSEGWQRGGYSHEEYFEEEEERAPGYAYGPQRPYRAPSSVRFSQDLGQPVHQQHHMVRWHHPHQDAAQLQKAQYYQQEADYEGDEEGGEEEEGFEEDEGEEEGFEEDEGEAADEGEKLEEQPGEPPGFDRGYRGGLRPNPFIALHGLPVRSEPQIHNLVCSILDPWGIEVHKVKWRRRKPPGADDGAGISSDADAGREKVLVQLCDPSQIETAIRIFASTKIPRLKDEHVAAAAARAAEARALLPPGRLSPPWAATKHAASSPPMHEDGGAGGWGSAPSGSRRNSQGGSAPSTRAPGSGSWRQASPGAQAYGSQVSRAPPGALMGRGRALSPNQAPARPRLPSILKPSSSRGAPRHVQRYDYQGGPVSYGEGYGPPAAAAGPAAAATARSRETTAVAGATVGGTRSNNRYVLKMPPAKRAGLTGRDAPFPTGQ